MNRVVYQFFLSCQGCVRNSLFSLGEMDRDRYQKKKTAVLYDVAKEAVLRVLS